MSSAPGSWRRDLFDPLAWWLSRRELGRLMCRASELEEVVDATEAYQGRGHYARIPAVQRRPEILGLAERLRELSPRVIVEIGTFKGGTLFIFCRVAPEVRRVISIDLPGGDYGGGFDARRQRLYRQFLADRGEARMDFLRSDSHAPETVEALEGLLGHAPIDFLYIDGDHTYDGVRRDFELYGPLVRRGGMIAFHDIRTRDPGYGVPDFWNEVKGSYEHEELLDPESTNMGIGILHP